MSIKFADISEWQSDFDADAYLRAGTKIIIVRAHSGYKADAKMTARRDYVRSKPFTAVGYYQYVAKDRDAAQQAREFVAVIGKLQANEFAVADFEEGSGSQAGRADAWFKVVDPWGGFKATLYSGASFMATNMGGYGRYSDRPRWIAAYPGSYTANTAVYPKGATFWQYSDRARFTGLAGAVDGNYYPKTAADLLAEVRGGKAPAPAPAPAPKPKQQQTTQAAVVKNNGDIVVFEVADDGCVWRRAQANGKWQATWTKMGKPGG